MLRPIYKTLYSKPRWRGVDRHGTVINSFAYVDLTEAQAYAKKHDATIREGFSYD